jgi:putative ABC transport system permease protein
VLRDSLWLWSLGLLIGLPLAAATMRTASTLLFGLSPADLATMLGAAALLATAAAVAAWLPAWRAARVSPDVALRCE